MLAAVCTVGVAGLVAAGIGIGHVHRTAIESAVASVVESGTGAPESTERTAPETQAGVADSQASTLVDPAWISSAAEATGIPERALAAYAGAALRVQEEFPKCGIGWNTLAGVGSVETHHGTINGSAIGDDGVAAPRILGPALDGTRFDAIPDTDGGSLDGDAEWDRAVGPMQFLPQTWQTYGRDATGSGSADINQIDDAALGTAAMLCAVGGDLTVPENWIAAVDAYNPNAAYNRDVAYAADTYAAATTESGLAQK